MAVGATTYPPGAYAPDGVPWWRLSMHPGTRRPYGDELKIAAWLAFNKSVGETFTMRELRRVLGSPRTPNAKEHLNRRLSNLRPDGWVVLSYRTAPLPQDTYKLKRIGWHPGSADPRPPRMAIAADVRRFVIERDNRRCVVCSVASGDPYPGEPYSIAVLTVGHRVPQARVRGVTSFDELQTECQRCNESVRDEVPDPPRLAEVMPQLRRLSKPEKELLCQWVVAGRRLSSRADALYDRIRLLTPSERDSVRGTLREMLGLDQEQAR